MELTADLDAPCSAAVLFGYVGDLDRYPEWLGIVRRAEPDESGEPTSPAWIVDLQAQLGPLSRAKRLRMVRTTDDPPHRVVFERRELDGRVHGGWVLTADVHPVGEGSRLEMSLRYDGRLWGPAVAALLHQEIERSRARLLELVTAS